MGGPDPEYVVVTVGPYGKLTGVVGNAIMKENKKKIIFKLKYKVNGEKIPYLFAPE